ncbi:unnamed protein product [Phytophthora lilii]|uniref:Unnamed protein product n=1 Tax=Phytophthora lilii TaxID=2077276 RepID=A0A9W6THX3_9STRA|nr:unnamed protein product [Phytophthora lilii]
MATASASTEETSQRLVSVLKTFARDEATLEEMEYTAELLIATAEEEQVDQDRQKLVGTFVEVLQETEFLDAARLSAIAEQLADVLLGSEGDDSEEDQESPASRRRRLRKERLETQFAIGKSCLVVLEEDDAWHPARITKHIGESDDSENEDDENAMDDRPIEVEVEFIEFGKKQIVREDEMVLDEDVAGREDAEDITGLCEMCERPMNLTAHHVIPRVTHSNNEAPAKIHLAVAENAVSARTKLLVPASARQPTSHLSCLQLTYFVQPKPYYQRCSSLLGGIDPVPTVCKPKHPEEASHSYDTRWKGISWSFETQLQQTLQLTFGNAIAMGSGRSNGCSSCICSYALYSCSTLAKSTRWASSGTLLCNANAIQTDSYYAGLATYNRGESDYI